MVKTQTSKLLNLILELKHVLLVHLKSRYVHKVASFIGSLFKEIVNAEALYQGTFPTKILHNLTNKYLVRSCTVCKYRTMSYFTQFILK